MFRSDKSIGGSVLCDGFHYRIDQGRSKLIAYIDADSLSWGLEVFTIDDSNYKGNYEAPICAPSMHVVFRVRELGDWRELAKRRVALDYKRYLNDPILSDQPAGLYMGYHLFPFQHEIAFAERQETRFPISWQFDARENPESSLVHVEVASVFPFSGVEVSFTGVFEELKQEHGGEFALHEFEKAAKEWKPDLDLARNLIAAHFAPSDFGPPERRMWSLRFPTIAET